MRCLARWFRCIPEAAPPPLPRRPNSPPAWATQPTDVFPQMNPGRAGYLTRGGEWRAGGWRRNEGQP
jgi:hypothetical protein